MTSLQSPGTRCDFRKIACSTFPANCLCPSKSGVRVQLPPFFDDSRLSLLRRPVIETEVNAHLKAFHFGKRIEALFLMLVIADADQVGHLLLRPRDAI
jgi:hypothetical protein